jgi:hypothetical protein
LHFAPLLILILEIHHQGASLVAVVEGIRIKKNGAIITTKLKGFCSE